jgi:6-phosphogluconate dehydrogenase
MKVGMVGLGRMGGNMAERLRRHGIEVVGWARDPEKADVASLADLVAALDPPRLVWLMLPAGEATEHTVDQLHELLAEGDVVVDGANGFYRDAIRRAERLAGRGIGFVDCGVSGGVWGLEQGYALMVGGDPDVVERARPVFEALTPPGGFARMGAVGAGHYTKMVHNGVEYALMEAYGEGYELLTASELGVDVPAALEVWRHGSVVRSWLLDLLAQAVADDPGLTGLKGWADDSGHGRSTVDEAVRLGVPIPTIAASLFARFTSRQDDSPAMKVVAALRREFGGHAVK